MFCIRLFVFLRRKAPRNLIKSMKMKIFFALVICLLFAMTASGQAVKEDYQRMDQLLVENAAAIKALKKQYKFKIVTVGLKDGTGWYYRVVAKGKENNMGVADSLGNIIIEPAYNEISYVPALPKGKSVADEFNGKKIYIYHDATPAHFLAKRHGGFSWADDSVRRSLTFTTILDPQGHVIKKDIPYKLAEMPGYFAVGIDKTNLSNFEAIGDTYVGLMSNVGEMIVEPRYKGISVNQKDPSLLYLYKEIEGITRKGVFSLKEKKTIIPCVYYAVDFKDGKWMVKKNSVDQAVAFDPKTALQQVSYRDDGERFYDKGEYDKVIEYYAQEGVEAPWAKFFTGMAIKHKADSASIYVIQFKMYMDIYGAKTEFIGVDFNAARKNYEISKNLLEAYLQQGDGQYQKEAAQALDHFEVDYICLDDAIKEYPNQVARWRQLRAAARAQAAAEEQRARERNAAIANIFGAMMNNITNSLNRSSQRTSAPVSAGSGGGGVSYSSSTSSSSSSSSSGSTADRKTCRRCHGEGTIVVESTISAGYGLEKKMTTCTTCGKSYDKTSLVHRHDRCPNCHGSGYYEVK